MSDDKSENPEESLIRMTEEEIIAVNIGQPEVLNATIHLSDYDPAWPLVFRELEKEIRKVLKDRVRLLEHVGSTSIPRLSAKPIIDIVLAVSNSSDEAAYVPTLERLGYVLKIREPEWWEHRLLKFPDPKVNLHVFTSRCEEIKRMMAFRDWLRNNPEDLKRYEKTKQHLSKQTWKHVQNYADAKSEVVKDIMTRAYPI